MTFSMLPLLIHTHDIPTHVRVALHATLDDPPDRRPEQLEAAAEILRRATGIELDDARELVGLPSTWFKPPTWIRFRQSQRHHHDGELR